jgi:ADP-ribosylglycohydrolase
MNSTVTDRAAGVLLGQACGDALGVPYEFGTPPSGDELAEMRGGGLGPYQPGEWSDDTQMALCIAQVSAIGANLTLEKTLDEVAERFLDWGTQGASDIGIQTRAVLAAARSATGPASQRLREAAAAYASTHPHSAGNGALMRTSIVGLTAIDDREATAAAARAVAELTHGDPLAAESCVLWSEAVQVAVTEGRFDLLAGLDMLPSERRGQWEAWIKDATGANPVQFNPNGFTVTALQAAWAAITATPTPPLDPAIGLYPCLHLQQALQAAVRVGHDTDTVAAIAGGLLGARWGASAVPWQWRRAVHGWPGVGVRELVSLGILTGSRGTSDASGWPIGERVETPDYDYTERPAIRHPYDDGVWLGTVAATGHDADAVISMCRLGVGQVPADGVELRDHLEAWLIDTDDSNANPNLDFVLADIASAIAGLRAESRRVLVHCVAAQQRTPSAAIAYARRLGVSADEAIAAVRKAVPGARGHGRLWDAAASVPATASDTDVR